MSLRIKKKKNLSMAVLSKAVVSRACVFHTAEITASCFFFHQNATRLSLLSPSQEPPAFFSFSFFFLCCLGTHVCSVIYNEWIISLTQLVIRVLRQTSHTGCFLFIMPLVFFFAAAVVVGRAALITSHHGGAA